MHIFLGVLAVIGAIAFFVIRANRAAQAGKELLDTATDLKNAKRRHDWNRHSGKDAFEQVEDPRLAGMAILYALAASDGELGEEQYAEVVSEAAALFRAAKNEAEELVGQARWLFGQSGNVDAVIARMAPLVQTVCDAEDLAEFRATADRICSLGGSASDVQLSSLRVLETRLGL